MRHALLALAAAGLATVSTGCTMCAHPYDNCGPTFMGGCGECCDPDARAGSVLTASAETVAVETSVGEPTLAPGEALMPLPEGDQTAPPDISRRNVLQGTNLPREAKSRAGRAYR